MQTLKKAAATLSLLGLAASGAHAQVVISQVYGAGGNSGSIFTNDFIELYNSGTSAASLAGYSVQYNSAAGSSIFQVTSLTSITLNAGQFYLVQEAAGTGGTTAPPTADVIGTINMSGTAGRVALVNSTTALAGTTAANASGILDFVGFGATANTYEGAGPTPAFGDNRNSVYRFNGTAIADTNNNSKDFVVGGANPRNSTYTGSIVPPAAFATPEPSSVAPLLLGAGALGLIAVRRRRTMNAA